MKKILSLAVLSLPLMASAATNLLSNGSFESGLTGWTVANGGGSDPVSTITYNVAGPYGTIVSPDDFPTSTSPDAVGTMAAYFVDDTAVQSLSQTITVAAGSYDFGISLYAPSNGLSNAFNSTFQISFDGLTSGPVTVSPTLGSDTWGYALGSTFLAAGAYTFSVEFAGGGVQANDLVVDRAFVTAVPEPETYALMLAGLCAVGFMARRRRA